MITVARIDLWEVSLVRYWATTAYKTAYYSFWLPVALGMAMARFSLDDPDYKGTKDVHIRWFSSRWILCYV